jgi:hypothetical protein
LLRSFQVTEQNLFWASILFVFGNCILNYSRTAAPYVVGFSLNVIALYCLLAREDRPSRIQYGVAILCAALAVSIWFLYILAAPALVCARPLLRPSNGAWQRAAALGLAIGLCVLGIYGSAFYMLNLHSWEAVSAWRTHGATVPLAQGLQKVPFGLTKLFVNIESGTELKRYLAHDPFNPVAGPGVLFAIFAKVLVVLMFSAIIVLGLLRTRKVRILFLSVIGLLPVLLFACFFDGGARERFFPFLPIALLVVGIGINRLDQVPLIALRVLIAIIALINVTELWRWRSEDALVAAGRNLRELPRSQLLLVVPTTQDKLLEYRQSNPLQLGQLEHLDYLVAVPMEPDSIVAWKSRFLSRARKAELEGSQVWVSRELCKESPSKSSFWVENPAQGVGWQQVSAFFTSLRYSDSTEHFFRLSTTSTSF